MTSQNKEESYLPKPAWLKVPFPSGSVHSQVRALLGENSLHTICQEANCPNMAECFGQKNAAFMILGDTCTRNCKYCAVKKGVPKGVDCTEPEHLLNAVLALGLNYVTITSPTRDDLPDGGASHFAECISTIRAKLPNCKIEVLIPDFKGNHDALKTIILAKPDIINHNIEVVERLFPIVRAGGDYSCSIQLLKQVSKSGITTKSGMMLGLGESNKEILATFSDLRDAGVSLLSIGQYLRPTRKHYPVQKYYTPQEFAEFKKKGEAMGFSHVESGPLVRSSYHACDYI